MSKPDLIEPNIKRIERESLKPASRSQIALWLLTGGRKGKLWEFEWTRETEISYPPDPRTAHIAKAWPPKHFACRSDVQIKDQQDIDDFLTMTRQLGVCKAAIQTMEKSTYQSLGDDDLVYDPESMRYFTKIDHQLLLDLRKQRDGN